MSFRGVIFDFDGVLLDSGRDGFEWAEKARREKALELGYEYNDNRGFLFRADSLEEMKELVENSQLTWHDFVEIEKAVAERKLELVEKGEMELFPSAKEVLESLDVPAALVSNAYGEAVDHIVKQLSLDSHLEFWTAPRLDDIERYHSIAKPETDMLDRAMKQLGTRDVIMVGDSGFDLKAAENAGIESVLINSYNKDIDVNPTYRVESLEQILRIDGLQG